MAPANTILVVSDDPRAAAIGGCLQTSGYDVAIAESIAAAQAYVHRVPPSLVVFDLLMPPASGAAAGEAPAPESSPGGFAAGWAAYRRLRNETAAPVIMLGRRWSSAGSGAEDAEIVALETGADDYVARPYNPLEVAARVRAVLRRHGPDALLAAAGSR